MLDGDTEPDQKILNLKDNFHLPHILDKNKQQRAVHEKPYDEKTFDSHTIKDGIYMGAGEAQGNPLMNHLGIRTTQTSRKNLTTDSSYKLLKVQQ